MPDPLTIGAIITAFAGGGGIAAMFGYLGKRTEIAAKKAEAAPAVAIAQIEAKAVTDKEEITGSYAVVKDAMARMDRIEAAARDERRACDARINALETASFAERQECARQLGDLRAEVSEFKGIISAMEDARTDEIRLDGNERAKLVARIAELERVTPLGGTRVKP